MDKERIKAKADSFFEWPDPKRRDHVTLTSCLIFAEVIAGMAVEAERRRMRDIYEAELARLMLFSHESLKPHNAKLTGDEPEANRPS